MVASPIIASSSGALDRAPAELSHEALVLCEKTPFVPCAPAGVGADDKTDWVCWRELAHVWPHRLGLVILAGAQARFEPMDVEPDTSLFLSAGAALNEISADGLDLVVRFTPVHEDGSTGAEQTVLTRHITAFDPEHPWVELTLPLGSLVYGRGVLALECGPGPLGEPSADWLAIYEMVVGPAAQQSLHRARCHKDRRYAADMARFELRHDASQLDKDGDYAGSPLVPEGRPAFGNKAGPVTTLERQLALPVSVVELGNRALARGLQHNPPDFQQRLGARLAALRTGNADVNRKLRVLSLCSGVGRVERALLRGIWPEAVALTLWDRNADVAEVTASRLATVCDEVTVVEGDVNHLDLQGERYDVILCASGLHHLIELEHVLSTVSAGLEDDGEFWSVAEFVGRNGYRMWPGARAAANAFFAELPEAYRVSRVGGGAAELDEQLSDLDQSVQTLEGIRSQEIEGLLQRHFSVQEAQTRSCFLWSLLEPAYVANYDLHSSESVEIIERAAALDVQHQLAGGRPAILNGVYRKSH